MYKTLNKLVKRIGRKRSRSSDPFEASAESGESRNIESSGENNKGCSGIPGIEELPAEELKRLNHLLPWTTFVLDGQGRRFGACQSMIRHEDPKSIPDARIVELDKRFGLAGRRVLEAGCFEGIHTVGLMQFGAMVTAIDGRIENVIKTLVRARMFGFSPEVHWCDFEAQAPAAFNMECDIIHHARVLDHLTNPIEHLAEILPKVSDGLMLDTHVAPEGKTVKTSFRDFKYRYYRSKEARKGKGGHSSAGMRDHARWIALDDLLEFLRQNEFSRVDLAGQSNERSGPRALIYAHR